MAGLAPGDMTQIHPHHPFYGGVMGIYEFMVGPDSTIAVFSHPQEADENRDDKIYFMIRPDDAKNYLAYLSRTTSVDTTQVTD
jgi:hypothetical protein